MQTEKEGAADDVNDDDSVCCAHCDLLQQTRQ